ncbi:MAG: hypothetical protein IJ498_05020, partial [Akkermansia sp.]|nr:hypothetical protein [Akkermansia sp.]
SDALSDSESIEYFCSAVQIFLCICHQYFLQRQNAQQRLFPLLSVFCFIGQAGFYPPPAALSGFPPGGIPAAQGLLVPPALAAHSPFAAGACVRIPAFCGKSKTLSSGYFRY